MQNNPTNAGQENAAQRSEAEEPSEAVRCSELVAIREEVFARRELLKRLAEKYQDDREQLRARAAVLGDIWEVLSTVERRMANDPSSPAASEHKNL